MGVRKEFMRSLDGWWLLGGDALVEEKGGEGGSFEWNEMHVHVMCLYCVNPNNIENEPHGLRSQQAKLLETGDLPIEPLQRKESSWCRPSSPHIQLRCSGSLTFSKTNNRQNDGI